MGKVNITKIIYPSFLILCIIMSAIPMIMSYDILQIKDYSAFQDILQKWYISYSYFAQVIIANIDYFNFSITHLISSLFTCLSFMNLLVLACILYLIAAKKEALMKTYNRRWSILCIIYGITYVIIGGIMILGFSLTTLERIISLFQYASIVILIGHFILIWYASYALYEFYKDVIYNKELKITGSNKR